MSDNELGEPGMKENIAMLIAYLFSIPGGLIVFFVIANTDKKLKFHAMQSVLLGVGMVIVSGIVSVIPILNLFAPVLSLAFALACVALGFFAYQGKTFELPFIADVARSIADK